MLVLATGVFGLPLLSIRGSMLVPILVILFVFGIALGIFGSAMVLRFGPASEWLIWPIPALLAPFAGVFYPGGNPAALDAGGGSRRCRRRMYSRRLRAVVAGKARRRQGRCCSARHWRWLLLVLSSLAFGRVYRFVVRSGLLARYSSESSG